MTTQAAVIGRAGRLRLARGKASAPSFPAVAAGQGWGPWRNRGRSEAYSDFAVAFSFKMRAYQYIRYGTVRVQYNTGIQ